MVHTEESLMQLFEAAVNQVACRSGDDKVKAMRLAIREVLAEIERADYATRRAVERAEKAEAECERLREDLRGLEEVRREQAAGRDYWSAECERLRKDAERYRWLRDKCDAYQSPDDCWILQANGQEWDAAIDAAMKDQP